jgi:hypothetical protein
MGAIPPVEAIPHTAGLDFFSQLMFLLPHYAEGKMLRYKGFRFLIQFRARHLERSSRKIQKSPAMNSPYRSES